MSIPRAVDTAPPNDEMLVMDVVDTLRHGIGVPIDVTAAANREVVLAQLRAIYARQGIAMPDATLVAGLAAMADGRFTYPAPRDRLLNGLAQLYVARGAWGPPVFSIGLALAVGLGGYFFGYRPYRASQAAQAQMELTQVLPAQMDSLYQVIFNETKIQSAASDADELRNRGKEAAQKGDRQGAERAVADLTALRQKLEQAYTLRVVDRDGVKPGFWTFPPSNSEATNYYIVVEAVDGDGRVLSVPVTSEVSGETDVVTQWGLRVPQSLYEAVMADKQDNGVIDHGLVGFKQDGFTDVDYVVPVLGGAVTRW